MQDFSWFGFSVVESILIGASVALYKLPAMRNQSKLATSFWAQVVPGVLSLIFFWKYLPLTSGHMIFWAMVWGSSFALISLLQFFALRYVDTNVVFPTVSAASLVITILIGLTFLHDKVSLLQFVGMALVIITIVLFFFDRKSNLAFTKNVLLFGSILVGLSVFNKVVQKFIAVSFDIHVFQIYQYLFATCFILGVSLFRHGTDLKMHFNKVVFVDGLLIGLFGFLGGYALLIALSKGPISLVNTIHSLYIIPTALVGFFVFSEKLTKQRIALLGLTILALVFIRLG